MHFIENLTSPGGIRIVALWGKNEVMDEFGVPKETLDAGYYLAVIKLKA